ncbi:MAG: hypothetical protein HY903_19150 [Deltaproteobacteria bacterium]|nr:hypothetical protein [Deltaproteobacteria bacterium]
MRWLARWIVVVVLVGGGCGAEIEVEVDGVDGDQSHGADAAPAVAFDTFAAAALGTTGPLRLHPANPRYFTDDTGRAIYLTGSHTWYLIQGGGGTKTAAQFDAFLDWSQAHGHNFVRLWTGWSSISHQNLPWNRPGPGVAKDGKAKLDMKSFNQAYFDLLRDRVLRVQARGMYCSVMFFGSGIGFNTSTWASMAWNPNNNINTELARAFSVTDGKSFFTTDSAALGIERALVRKFVDTLNDVDNLLWETVNEPCHTSPGMCESTSPAVRWDKAMVDYARAYEASKPKQHPVGLTGGGGMGTTMLASNADWVSPDWSAYVEGGPATFAGKLVISDTDHLSPYYQNNVTDVPAMRKWVWKTFTRGGNPIYMDPYDSNSSVINPAYDPVRAALGDTLLLADGVDDLAAMLPSDTACSTRYCLVSAGKEYLVYQPNAGASFTLSLPAGDYAYQWFNPVTHTPLGTGSRSGGTVSFAPPISTDAVLHVWRQTAVVPPPPAVPDVIVDNGGAGTSHTGTWQISGGTLPYGSSSLWARNGATYTWRAALAKTGTYKVYLWWSQYPSRATSVPVTITYNGGAKSVAVNQQANGGKWNLLGSFPFDAAVGAAVTLAAPGAAPASYCADAVKLQYVP